jgi:hypothetical protein
VGLTNMDVTKEMVEVGIPGIMGLVKTTSAYRESNNKLCNVRSVWPGPWGEGHRAIVVRVDGAAGGRQPVNTFVQKVSGCVATTRDTSKSPRHPHNEVDTSLG